MRNIPGQGGNDKEYDYIYSSEVHSKRIGYTEHDGMFIMQVFRLLVGHATNSYGFTKQNSGFQCSVLIFAYFCIRCVCHSCQKY